LLAHFFCSILINHFLFCAFKPEDIWIVIIWSSCLRSVVSKMECVFQVFNCRLKTTWGWAVPNSEPLRLYFMFHHHLDLLVGSMFKVNIRLNYLRPAWHQHQNTNQAIFAHKNFYRHTNQNYHLTLLYVIRKLILKNYN
jgi:hypothetical protein